MRKRIARVAVPLLVLAGGLMVAACQGTNTGATDVTATTATLNASASCAGGSPTPCQFYWEWGPLGSYTNQSVTSSPYTGTVSNFGISDAITGLSASTKYQYTVCGKGDNVSSYYCENPPSYFTTTPSVTLVAASTYGVKCDNSTDDTSNLQTAINSTASAGEGLLLPSSSTCLVSSTLSLPSNTFIEGGGLTSSVIKSSVTGNALVNTASSSGESNVTLARFAVQGAYSGEPFGTGTGNSPGLRLDQVDSLIIDEFGISHVSGVCMSLLGDTHETVENSNISLCGRDGVTNFETAAVSNIDITQNTISDVGDDAIAVDVSRCGCPPPGGNLATGVSITNNTITGWPTSHGTAPYLGRGIALNGVGGNTANTVTYNSIDSTFSAGIMVSGCTSSWCGSGYANYPDTNLTVQSNNVVNAGQLSTVSNSGVGPQPYGVYVYNAAAPVNITSNTFSNALDGNIDNTGCTGGCSIQTS